MKFTIENKLRPCFVDGKKALFHRWADKENLIIQSKAIQNPRAGRIDLNYYNAFDDSHNLYKLKNIVAIVEYEDGTVAEIEPTSIKFVAGIFNDYSFVEQGKEV